MLSKKRILLICLASGFFTGNIFPEVTASCIINIDRHFAAEDCPMPGLEVKINEAMDKYIKTPSNEAQVGQIINLLIKTIPSYGCRRSYDKSPIPAWWMAKDDSITKWFAFLLERINCKDESAFKLFVQFYATSDGYFKEGMSYRMIDIFLSQPSLVLDSWDFIREYHETIVTLVTFLSPEKASRMVAIYYEIGAQNKDTREKCDEIIQMIKRAGRSFLTFSCKTRGFCPSCHAKRREEWGRWMRETLLLDMPHRQVVLTIPKTLRIFFKYRRRLLGELSRVAVKALSVYLEALAGEPLVPGIIVAVQTFGDRINFHPHLHLLVTEGGMCVSSRENTRKNRLKIPMSPRVRFPSAFAA